MEIRCPYCEKTVQIPGGGQFTCPSCKAIFAVDLEPPPASPPASTAAPPPLPATTAPMPQPGAAPAGSLPPPLPVGGTDAPPPLPGTAPGLGPPPLPGAAPPAAGGPICAKHPGRPAGEVCRRCGNFMCSLCVIPFQNERYCPDCIDKLGPGGTQGNVPWENDREKLGIVGAYLATMKRVLLDPDAFYQGMPTDAGLGPPLGYMVLFASIFGIIGHLLTFVVSVAFMGGLMKAGGPGARAFGPENVVGVAFQCFITPFAALIGAFVGGAIYHVVALLLGGTASYEATVRIVCYAAGSAALFDVIPWFGPLLIAPLWAMGCHYFAFKNVHRLAPGKAALCAGWPLLLALCCCGSFLALLTFALLAGTAGGGGGGGGGF